MAEEKSIKKLQIWSFFLYQSSHFDQIIQILFAVLPVEKFLFQSYLYLNQYITENQKQKRKSIRCDEEKSQQTHDHSQEYRISGNREQTGSYQFGFHIIINPDSPRVLHLILSNNCPNQRP